jgi:hypothetical protein
MANNIIPPKGHPAPATYRLTREFLATIAPGFDPEPNDEATNRRLHELLADERWIPWLECHPDRELVAQYWQEDEGYAEELFDKLTGRKRLRRVRRR